MGRPAKPIEERKQQLTVYLSDELIKWLTDKAGKRESTVSSLLSIIIKDRMNKEKANS
jgi:hypothetical protein